MSGSFFSLTSGGLLSTLPTSRGGATTSDTVVTLTPSAKTGSVTVTASSNTFASTDVGRLLSIKDEAPARAASTAYVVGDVFYHDDRGGSGVKRIYRVIQAGTSAAASMSGTTPNYDLAAPMTEGLEIRDGTCVLRYLGRGKAVWGWGTITAYTSATQVTVAVATDGPFANTTAALHWRLGEFSDARGWPRVVCFYQNRMILASTTSKPHGVWTSETGDFEKFSPCDPDGVVLDTNGLVESLDDDKLSRAHFLLPGPRGVFIGTSSGGFLFGPSSNTNRVLTPSNAEARRQTDSGAISTTPGVRIGGASIHVDEGGRQLREVVYDFATDSYKDNDLTLLAEHIAGTGIVEIAYQRNPDGVIWAVREDGVLLSLTYDADQEVRAWGRHILGGTDVVVESVCCVPAADGKSDDVYVSVRRTIGGATVRYVEVIGQPFREDRDGQSGAFHVDCGLSYSGAPVTSVTGLSHLEGETVRVFADGAVRSDRVVTAGAIYIDTPAASVVHVGLPFRSRVKTLPLEGGGGKGTAMGQARRVHEVSLRLLETGAARIAMGDGERELIDFRDVSDAMDTAAPLFTGVKRWPGKGGWDRDFVVTIESYHAEPLTVLGVAMEVVVNG